jgi:methionyl-tRNA synthetase
MDKLFCQSCGMPLENDDVIGTNKDYSKNNDYCIYCYKNGNFTENVSMDEMIEISLRHMKELFKDNPDFDEKAALDNMKSFFPKLKRWA